MSDERYAVVTGSSSGIGKAIAIAAAKDGWNVMVHGCGNRAGAEETAAVVKGLGRRSEVVLGDISNPVDRNRLIDVAQRWAPIDAWVHNAGVDVLTGAMGAKTFEQKFDRLWEVDVRGTILLARQIAESYRDVAQRNSSSSVPSMVFIGWDQARNGMEGDAGQMFGPIKAAVISFSQSLAQDLAPHVRVNCVAPGWIKTEWGNTTDDYWNKRARESSLMNRWGTPEDVAAGVVFLISDQAGFVTGQVLDINGGWNRRFDRP